MQRSGRSCKRAFFLSSRCTEWGVACAYSLGRLRNVSRPDVQPRIFGEIIGHQSILAFLPSEMSPSGTWRDHRVRRW